MPISGVYPYRRRSDVATKSDEGLLTLFVFITAGRAGWMDIL